jgi:glycogen debranching enzyme
LEDIIQVENQYYVLATSSLADDRTRVLKYGDTFAVLNRLADIEVLGLGEQGIYHCGTRHLSRYTLRLQDDVPQLLRSTIQEDDAFLTVDLMNPDIHENGQLVAPRGALHIFRSKFLWRGVCYEKIRLFNFGLAPLDTTLNIQFAADFADIFHVRGMERHTRGASLEPKVGANTVTLSYRGRDRVLRRTHLEFSPEPLRVAKDSVSYGIRLEPREEMAISVTVACEHDEERALLPGFDRALADSTNELEANRKKFCAVSSAHQTFNRWFSRSRSDVILMINGNPEGAYPYAGVPWFSTVFGRDALITAMQCLWAAPWMAESVLRFLALHQAVEENPEKEAEPGKILHEMRHGELANLKEVPFGLYYGSVDSTPLFVLLAGMHFEHTGNREFLESIWPNVQAALDWIDHYGDFDGDGFVEYERKGDKGLIQQGWKDSHDAIFHADGHLTDAPIALCEVQAYVYGARVTAARMAMSMGQPQLANKLQQQAEELQQKFEREYWDEEIGAYVLALDGREKPCRVLTSNAGQALFTGIASNEHAARLAKTLLAEGIYCGWGIRTLASSEVRYNPMSYHNGSVWPHDNAMIAAGLARYGYKREACQILLSLHDASTYMELNRLPELFCGFHKRPGVEGPTLYPVACSPQAWAAGAAYMLLQACLGMSFSHRERTVRFSAACLPEQLSDLRLTGLQVADATVDLDIRCDFGRLRVEAVGGSADVRVKVEG